MADKQNAFALSTPGNPVFLSAKGGVPATYKFQTREGGLGVLQIVGFTDEDRAEASRRWTPPTVEQLAPREGRILRLASLGQSAYASLPNGRTRGN